jgi:hypothetical protein
MKFGVTLSSRGVLVGLCTTATCSSSPTRSGLAADGFGVVRRRCSSTGGSMR